MRRPWDCPENCPNRKPGCQNPNICEIYRLRYERSLAVRSGAQCNPFRNLKRTMPLPSGGRRSDR